jgi:hypothetical protein
VGSTTGGFGFQHKEQFKPLQAADILAWQINTYMPKIYPEGQFNFDKCHSGFKILRLDQEMDIGFFSESNINDWLKRIETIEAEHGIII